MLGEGDFVDIRGQQAQRADIYDPASYAASQVMGEDIRASGGAGIIYDSVRHQGGVNVVAYRPRKILRVVQADHWRLTVEAASPRIGMKKLNGNRA